MPFGKKDVKKKSSNFEKKEILDEGSPVSVKKHKKLTGKQRVTLLLVLLTFIFLPFVMAVVARRGKLPGFERLVVLDNPFSSTVTIVSGGQREQERLNRLESGFFDTTRGVSGVWAMWVYDFSRSKPYTVNPSEKFVLEPDSQLSLILSSSACSALGYVSFGEQTGLSPEWGGFISGLMDNSLGLRNAPQSLQNCMVSGDLQNDLTKGGVFDVSELATEVRKMAEGGATSRFRSSLYDIYSNSSDFDSKFLFSYTKYNPRSFYGVFHSSTKNQYLVVILGGGTVESEVKMVVPQILEFVESEFGN